MNVVSKARFTARRLKAASRSRNRGVSSHAREIMAILQMKRRANEYNILAGPFPELSAIHCFMRDWGDAIDGICRVATKYGRSEW